MIFTFSLLNVSGESWNTIAPIRNNCSQCPFVYNLVCGQDGKMYSSQCIAICRDVVSLLLKKPILVLEKQDKETTDLLTCDLLACDLLTCDLLTCDLLTGLLKSGLLITSDLFTCKLLKTIALLTFIQVWSFEKGSFVNWSNDK